MSPAALFDLDGTLIATKQLYLECYRRALAGALGRELSDDELLALRPRAETRLLRARVEDRLADGCLDDFYRHYESLHDQLFEGVYAGVPELLATLRGAGLPIGIVTGKSRRAWQITAARAALGEFDVVVVDDDVEAAKPDPGGIRLALRALNADPGAAVYVGDTMGDVRAARAAGVRPVAALWSKRDGRRDSFAERAEREGARLAAAPADVARALVPADVSRMTVRSDIATRKRPCS